mmetsp:Transcript_140165/g.349320  ORF Transcript_140165/g.349320 Transcript_140165/m.349320 type:complete len:261 (-) Transcript_140165:363-1145(-)
MKTIEMAIHAADCAFAEHAIHGEGPIGESSDERPQNGAAELLLASGHPNAPGPEEREILRPSLELLAALDPVDLQGAADQGQAPWRHDRVHIGRHRCGKACHAARRVEEALWQVRGREQAVPRLDHDTIGVDHATVPLNPALSVDDVEVKVDNKQLCRRAALRCGNAVEVGDEVHETVAHNRHLGLVAGEDDAVACPPRLWKRHVPLTVFAVEPLIKTMVCSVGHREIIREVLSKKIKHILLPASKVVPAVRHVVVGECL